MHKLVNAVRNKQNLLRCGHQCARNYVPVMLLDKKKKGLQNGANYGNPFFSSYWTTVAQWITIQIDEASLYYIVKAH